MSDHTHEERLIPPEDRGRVAMSEDGLSAGHTCELFDPDCWWCVGAREEYLRWEKIAAAGRTGEISPLLMPNTWSPDGGIVFLAVDLAKKGLDPADVPHLALDVAGGDGGA